MIEKHKKHVRKTEVFLDPKEENEVTMSEWLDKAEKYQKYRDYSPWNG